MFTEAARDYLAARDIKDAIKSYQSAVKIYDTLSKVEDIPEKEATKYRNESNNCRRQIDRLRKLSKGKWHGLEGKAAAVLAVGSLSLSFLFSSPNITGNAIANIPKISSILGEILFIIGLIASLIWINNKL
ncbi:MAG: hypothetical protein FJZ43_04675 [Candidatus Staskawiczbacteria bacterium]|nr:hypothetical protein [Candidatus Staskawiczbacteria bacterium]